jgi:seryl-tRNA(Sec) selenium transferase
LQPSHKRFKELINVSGTMTALGPSSVSQELMDGLKGISGFLLYPEPNPRGNPIRHLSINVNSKAVGLNALEISITLKQSATPIVVRDHETIHPGYLQLDPCNIDREQADFVIREITHIANLTDEDKKRLRARLPQRPNDTDLLVKSPTGWIAE